jgi:peptidoglycan hydrolase CwlO-like protein
MDANQLQELATNARLDHWPPHLGVTTEAEKVEYMANALSDVTRRDAQIEALENEIETMVDETTGLENKIDAKDDQIEKLETKVDELTEENKRLCSELAALQPKGNEAQ